MIDFDGTKDRKRFKKRNAEKIIILINPLPGTSQLVGEGGISEGL